MKNNWQIKKLEDICDFQNGFAFKSSDYVDSGFFVMRIGNVQDGYISLSDPKYIRKSYKAFDKFILQSGDILISLTGNVGRVGVINEEHLPAVVNQRVARIILKNKDLVQKKFILYFLSSSYFTEKLTEAGHGAAQQNISTKDIQNLEIFIPPLPEQHRIAKILDEAFEKIAKAKENTEKNLKNSKELFESYLQIIFENPGKDWKSKKLGQILEIERGGSPRPIQKYLTNDPDGINWIKIGDTKNIDKYIFKTNQKIKPEGLKRSRLVSEGDFILSNSMSFGRPYIMKTSGAIHDGWLVLKEKDKNIIDTDYLYNILNSSYVFNQFNNLAAGSTVRNLNIGLVSSVEIPLPQIIEQKSIVKKLDSFHDEIKRLEKIYKQKLEDLEELKKSILKRAFNGDL